MVAAGGPRYEYKKVTFNLTPSNLRTRKIEESLDEMFSIIEQYAEEGWRFVQMIHPYTVNTLTLLIFEREKQ